MTHHLVDVIIAVPTLTAETASSKVGFWTKEDTILFDTIDAVQLLERPKERIECTTKLLYFVKTNVIRRSNPVIETWSCAPTTDFRPTSATL